MATQQQNGPICPEVTVRLTDSDGNAMMIIGKVTLAMRRAGVSGEIIDEFRKEAVSGDYQQVLRSCFKYANIE